AAQNCASSRPRGLVFRLLGSPGTGFAGNDNIIMTRAMIVEPDRRQRIARLTPLADVLAHLDALVKPVTPRMVDLTAAGRRHLAENAVIHAPVPATARALRDGWAVSSDLTTDAGGYAPAPLPSAAWVDVGEPLPGDADAVAPLDAVAIRDGAAQALAPVGPGEGALPTGADVAFGTTLLPTGRRLGGIELALLAPAGRHRGRAAGRGGRRRGARPRAAAAPRARRAGQRCRDRCRDRMHRGRHRVARRRCRHCCTAQPGQCAGRHKRGCGRGRGRYRD